jgi:hypothetical protein
MRFVSLALLVALQLLTACPLAVSDRFDTFIVPRDSIDLTTQRYILVPLTAQDDLQYPDSAGILIDSLVQATLEEAGIDVVPASEYADIWARLTREAGGFFDPYTGERDEPKYDAAVTELYRELQEKYTPLGFLYPELWVVDAPIRGAAATWDGRAVRAYPLPDDVDRLTAITLAITIEDTTGAELFVNGQGLELIEAFDTETMDMKLKTVGEILNDRDVIVETVKLALAPLVNRGERTTGTTSGTSTVELRRAQTSTAQGILIIGARVDWTGGISGMPYGARASDGVRIAPATGAQRVVPSGALRYATPGRPGYQ